MNCPNCNTPQKSDASFCSKCGHPLGNAEYRPVARKRNNTHGKGSLILIAAIMVLCLVIILAGVIGYHRYLTMVSKRCRKATDDIFAMAHDMDFSSVDPAMLPEELQADSDIRSMLKMKLEEKLSENSEIGAMAGYIVESIDLDMICDDITESASYEILSTDVGIQSCKVTVKTENTDYSKIVDTLFSVLYERFTDKENIRKSIESFLSSLFRGEASEESFDLQNYIKELYQEAKANTDKVSTTGVIEYGVKKGSWSVTRIDKKLFYTYYGIGSFLEQPTG